MVIRTFRGQGLGWDTHNSNSIEVRLFNKAPTEFNAGFGFGAEDGGRRYNLLWVRFQGRGGRKKSVASAQLGEDWVEDIRGVEATKGSEELWFGKVGFWGKWGWRLKRGRVGVLCTGSIGQSVGLNFLSLWIWKQNGALVIFERFWTIEN